MSYTKTTWVNGSAPALSAANLNKIEDGIYNNDASITTINTALAKYSYVEGTVSSSLATTSGTPLKAAQITLDAGVWVITGKACFPKNTSGVRRTNISTVSASTAVQQQVASADGITGMIHTEVYSVDNDNTTLYFNIFQNSGSSLTASAVEFKAIRFL